MIAGSTRMKAGTAQKIVLNLFSTAVMVKLGRVYRGLMVDMRARNAKLRRRAETIVSQIVGCPTRTPRAYLEQADGDVKTAVLLGFGLEPRRSRGAAAAPRRQSALRHRRVSRPRWLNRMPQARWRARSPKFRRRPSVCWRAAGLFAAIAERIERAEPRIVVFCGRGSSGHVGVYLRYLFEARLGLLASAAAPSVVTAYRRPPDMRDALFVVDVAVRPQPRPGGRHTRRRFHSAEK